MAFSNDNIPNFFVAGINYKKTEADVRGQFAVNNEQYKKILDLAPSFSLSELFVLSTCNRTEIYAIAEDATQLINLLCSQTTGTSELFSQLCYLKQGEEAVKHLFEVGAGLESQILGDYEIIGQLKAAVKIAKAEGYVGAFTERLVNSVLQSTKVIKNQTALSGGTVSVSFAAVQYIRKHVRHVSKKNILLLGTGKIGRNTCKNIIDYLGTRNITLINRTEDKALQLSEELGLMCAPLDELKSCVQAADIILVATNSAKPVLHKADVANCGEKLIIDLSIPCNVDKEVAPLPGVTLINVDELSRLKDETLQKRMAEVPKAKAIIAIHIQEFFEWTAMRRNVPFIHAVKEKLQAIHTSASQSTETDKTPSTTTHTIQKVISNMAVKMRQQHQPGCCYIEAVNEFINSHRN